MYLYYHNLEIITAYSWWPTGCTSTVMKTTRVLGLSLETPQIGDYIDEAKRIIGDHKNRIVEIQYVCGRGHEINAYDPEDGQTVGYHEDDGTAYRERMCVYRKDNVFSANLPKTFATTF